MEAAYFDADVVNGRVELWDRQAFYEHLRKLEGKRISVRIEEYKPHRNIDQNAYFHGVVVKRIADALGYEPGEMKAILKEMFLLVECDGQRFVRRTRCLTREEMAEFIERCIRWAAIEHGIIIPDPQ